MTVQASLMQIGLVILMNISLHLVTYSKLEVYLSIAEFEYMSLTLGVQEAKLLNGLLAEL